MTRFVLFIIFILISCNSEPTIAPNVTPDPNAHVDKLDLIKELLHLKKEIIAVQTNDSLLQIKLVKKSREIDSLIQNILDYKEIKLDLIVTKNRYASLKTEKNIIVKEVDSIEFENIRLYGENYIIASENKLLTGENRSLRKSVNLGSAVPLTGVKITGIGITTPLLGKSKEFVTNKTNKIKKVRINVSLPANKIAKHTKKNLTYKLYSADGSISISEDTIVNYQGKEITVNYDLSLITVKPESGKHRIDILLDKALQYTSVLVLD